MLERTLGVQGCVVVGWLVGFVLFILTNLFSVGNKPGLSYHRIQFSQEWGSDEGIPTGEMCSHFIFSSSLFISISYLCLRKTESRAGQAAQQVKSPCPPSLLT